MLRESTEALGVIAEDMQEPCSMHCLTRVLATPVELVRAFFLDPQCRMSWNSGSAEARTELNVLTNGQLMWMEFEQGMTFTTRISVFEHGACSTVIRVQLVPNPPHDVMAIYALGIDDLWEDRLYAITDLLLGFSDGHVDQHTISPTSPHHDQA